MKKSIYSFLLSSCLSITATLTAHAQAGSLDPTFGTGGKVITEHYSDTYSGYSVGISSDGKIVVAGGDSFFAARYKSNGTLDNSFAGDGTVFTDFGPINFSTAYSVAIQSDDKIVLAGRNDRGTGFDFALVRYKDSGTLDTGFDADGKVITSFGEGNHVINAVAIQSDGKIVVAGSSHQVAGDNHFAVARYNANGSLDNTFSSDGKLVTVVSSYWDVATAITIQNDGKIVVAGYSFNGFSDDIALVRYNTDGTLDHTFSGDGKVTTSIGSGSDSGSSVVIQSDGKIVVAGSSETDVNFDIALVRYNSDGSLDNMFDADGVVTTDFDSLSQSAAAVAIQEDGKIVVAGNNDNGFDYDFVLVRYNSYGSLDSIFGVGGEVTTDFGNRDDSGTSMAIQSDGKIVVAGTGTIDFFPDLALARYEASTVSSTENNAEENNLSISPNPFRNELVIKGTKENDEILFFDAMGNEIMRQKTKDEETKINTEGLLPGFYFLSYKNGNSLASTKLVKF